MREKYESLSVTVLRDLAKARGLRHLSGLKKRELVEVMLAEDEKEAKREQETKEEAAVNKTTDAKETKEIQAAEEVREENGYGAVEKEAEQEISVPMTRDELDSGTGYWRLCRTDTDLFAVKIIFREKRTCMYPLHRSGNSI